MEDVQIVVLINVEEVVAGLVRVVVLILVEDVKPGAEEIISNIFFSL